MYKLLWTPRRRLESSKIIEEGEHLLSMEPDMWKQMSMTQSHTDPGTEHPALCYLPSNSLLLSYFLCSDI